MKNKGGIVPMKKVILLLMLVIIILVGCNNNKKDNNSTEEQTNTIQTETKLTQLEIINNLINGKWLVTDITDMNGNQSKITRLDLFGSIYKHLDGIKFYEDGTFTNNIGIAADGEENNFQGTYKIQDDTIILTYNNNKTETLDIIQKENKIALTIKNLFNYSDEDYIVYYNKFNIDEDYNGEKIHSEENLLKETSEEKIISNTSPNADNKKLKTAYLKDFFVTEEDSSFETMQKNEDDNDSWIRYGMNGKFYGFDEDFWGGCSVWCAIGDYSCSAKASSTLKSQGRFSYNPENLINGIRNNAWIEGVDGYGIGEYIEITKKYTCHTDLINYEDIDYRDFESMEQYQQYIESMDAQKNRDIDLLTLCVVNGYAENMEKWMNNSRVKELKMYFNGKYVTNIELEDTISPQYIDISSLGLKAKSGEEISLKFEIADVYKGDKYDDTAITGIEVQFWTPNH